MSMSARTIPTTNFDRLAMNLFGLARPKLDRPIPVNAVQRGDTLILMFDLPGVAEQAIELSVERRVLTVRADRPNPIQNDDAIYLSELPWGPAERQIVLSDALDIDRATAAFADGVLTVTVPVADRARTKKITISQTVSEAQPAVEQGEGETA